MNRADELHLMLDVETERIDGLANRLSDAESHFGATLLCIGCSGALRIMGANVHARAALLRAVAHLRSAAQEYLAVAHELESVFQGSDNAASKTTQ